MAILLMVILLVAIDGYFIRGYLLISIGGYWWLFYWWLLMAILLVAIDGYFIGGYWLISIGDYW